MSLGEVLTEYYSFLFENERDGNEREYEVGC
jgi:hypothetical protein